MKVNYWDVKFLSVTLKLKRYYEEHPVGGEESLSQDTIFRFKQIHMEIDELNVKNLFFIEVGCGKGSLGRFICKSCQQYVGVDFSINAIKSAKKKRKDDMCYVCADASFLPFKEAVFDMVLCSEVLEHVPKYTKVLSECFFILKRLGKFLVTVPNRYNPNIFLSLLLTKKGLGGQEYDNPPPFPKLLRQLMRNGFKIENFYSFYPFIHLFYIIPIIPKVIKKRVASESRNTPTISHLAYFTQKIFTILLAKVTIFPFGLYILVRARK